MSRTINNVTAWPLRTWPKDIGVAIVVLVALALGLLVRLQVEGRTTQYRSSPDVGFSMVYPASWRTIQPASGTLFQAQDARTNSAFKSTVTIETRELDPTSPPTLQDLVDRRVRQHSSLTGYHFLSNTESSIDGARAQQVEYAYVAQPIDTPRSASLPVVVHSREFIVMTRTRTYYITLAAPDNEYASASSEFDRMVQTANLQ